jgi:SAM-dependent methyltransferase
MNWGNQPMSNQHWSFAATDNALRTVVGERDSAAIRLRLKPGCGLFGPYLGLSAGNCTARITLSGPRQGLVVMDISADTGNKVLVSRPFDLGAVEGDALALSVALAQPEKNCEVRLHCLPGVHADVSKVEIDLDTSNQREATDVAPRMTASRDVIRRLEIGSGYHPTPGFEHLDIDSSLPDLQYCSDCRKLPIFANDTFDEIRSIHCIEHVPWHQIKDTITEWVRVLKPGGKIHIETPSLRFICSAFISDGDLWKMDYDQMTPGQQLLLQIDGVPNKGLWANFKLFSSGIGFDNHYACLTGDNLAAYLREGGCSSTEVTSDVDFLIVEGIK